MEWGNDFMTDDKVVEELIIYLYYWKKRTVYKEYRGIEETKNINTKGLILG
jgi:hypothetical protein